MLHLFGWADRLRLIWTWRVDSRGYFSRDQKTKRGGGIWSDICILCENCLVIILVPIVVVDFFDVALQFQHQRFCIRKFNARTCWDLWANAALKYTCIYIYICNCHYIVTDRDLVFRLFFEWSLWFDRKVHSMSGSTNSHSLRIREAKRPFGDDSSGWCLDLSSPETLTKGTNHYKLLGDM